MIENFDEALELAAGAGDDRISSTGHPATVSPDRMIRVREIIKRFCEHLPPYTTAAEILDELDE